VVDKVPALDPREIDDKTLGFESMCVAGGQGMAMVLERLV
jgi:acetyl-CoA acetyltransferase